MSVADQINSVDTESTAGLVSRQVFVNNTVAAVFAVEGDKALTDRAGMVDLVMARDNVLPPMGEVVLLRGQRVIWLTARQDMPGLVAVVIVGGQVQERTVYEVAQIVVAGEERMDRHLCSVLASTHAEHREQRRRLNEAANEWADDNDLCDSYDEFMEQYGFEGRTRDYTAKVTITFYEDTEGRSFDEATDWTARDVVRMANELGNDLDWEVEEA